jgi:chaperonin GroES
MDINKLKPIGDRVIIKPLEENETRYGSLVVPTLSESKTRIGEIISVGEGRHTEYGQFITVQNLKPGTKVLIPSIGAVRFEVNGDEYFIAREQDLIAYFN